MSVLRSFADYDVLLVDKATLPPARLCYENAECLAPPGPKPWAAALVGHGNHPD